MYYISHRSTFEHAESLNFVNTRNEERFVETPKTRTDERSGSQLGNKRILIREREREEVGPSRVEEAGKGDRELDKTRRVGVTLGARSKDTG